jgi:integrase
VERLIQSVGTPLHLICILVLYATGLRREEVVRVKVEDIDSARMLIHIRQGKGKKDRKVMLGSRLLNELRDYWRAASAKPQTYLFPSQACYRKADLHRCARSALDIISSIRAVLWTQYEPLISGIIPFGGLNMKLSY